MSKIVALLSGTRVLEEVESPVNGKITVIKDFTWGTYIQVGGLTQSGGILFEVWQSTLRKIRNEKHEIQSVLILGFGGGSVAKIVHNLWREVDITGIDIDPIMVDMGKKYMGLGKVPVRIKIQDAFGFVKDSQEGYDLILIDLYLGDNYLSKFEGEKFLKNVKRLLNPDGLAVFNRLYGTDKRVDSIKFGRKLEKIFHRVEVFYPQANVEYICYN